MPVWRCPHCGTPQAETSRCWVCRRSTTCCRTCRHFRRGVAGGLGLCGLEPRRIALTGSEMRPCWTAPDALAAGGHTPPPPLAGDRELVPGRTFVPVDEPGADPRAAKRSARLPADPGAVAAGSGWSLWGDAER